MSILNWIFIGLLVIDAGLVAISLIKKIALMEKICCALFFPLALVHPPVLLLNFLPDSYHTFLITSIALALIAAAFIFSAVSSKKVLRGIAYTLYFAGTALWCELFRTIFYMQRIPQWSVIVIIAVCVLIIAAVQILSGRKTLRMYFFTSLLAAIAELLAVLALLHMILEDSSRGIMLFCGAILNLALVIFGMIDGFKLHIKKGMPIRMLALTASQFLTAFSSILLFR